MPLVLVATQPDPEDLLGRLRKLVLDAQAREMDDPDFAASEWVDHFDLLDHLMCHGATPPVDWRR